MTETNTAETPQAEPTKPVAVQITRNGVTLNFYDTEFQRASKDDPRYGLTYPAPDSEEMLENLDSLIKFYVPKNVVAAVMAKLRSQCQAAFEEACGYKKTSQGEVIKDKDGYPEPDFETFDLAKFTTLMTEGAVTSETKSELVDKLAELQAEFQKVVYKFIQLASPTEEQKHKNKAEIMELKGEIELTKLQIEKKTRVRRSQAEMTAESVPAGA